MRPLILKFQGLRSYREETIIDFSDRDLVAVIGDTGAGKSSILEAITYALYGTATWGGNVVTQLIGSNQSDMTVELTFRADDATWTVFRGARKSGQGNHRLVCLDREAGHIDGSSAVNAEIQRLVGLDYTGFLRAVILPQGKFQELLQSSPLDRNRVLKGIFRVDELEAVRENAKVASKRVGVLLADARVQRAHLFADPWQVAIDAGDAAATARERLSILESAVREIEAANNDAREATGRIAVLHADIDAIAKARRPGDPAAIQALIAIEQDINTRLAEASNRQAEHEAQAEAISTELADLDQQGLGESGLSRALATLDAARRDYRRLSTERGRIEDEKAALDQVASELDDLRAAIETSASAHLLARAALAAAEQTDTAARQRLDAARTAARDYRQAETAATVAASAMRALAAERATREAALATARESAASASALLQAARVAFEDANRHSHAAAAAAGHGPGDPCPVCARKLPAGFTPPVPEDAGVARAALDTATADEQSARAALTRAETRMAELESSEPATVAASEHALAALESATAALATIFPGASPATLPSLLGSVEKEVETAAAELRSARAEQEAASRAAALAASRVTSAEQAHATRVTALEEATRAFDDGRASLLQSLRELPVDLCPPLPPTIPGIEEATELVHQRITAVRQRAATRTAALAAARTAARDQETLRAEVEARVRRPLRGFAQAHAALTQCLATVSQHLGQPVELPGFPEALAEAHAAVLALDRSAAVLVDASGSRVTIEEARIAATTARIAAALESSGCDSVEALRSTTIDTAASLQRAEAELARALREQPIAKELDARIEGGTSLVSALDAVAANLTDGGGKFIDFVIRERQKLLLAVASEILGPMTGDRYGFAEDFKVVDRWSGQPREVKTLSGGETFLASLALALALVELAGRGGGRLEALFLDEGFGSLDANTLPEALKALEKQASGGRLVAVISHLRAVAESIDHVLHVTRDASAGSSVHWLTPSERDALLSSDAESGLLS